MSNSDDLWLFTSYADESDVQAVTEVIERGTWWANGPEIEAFEEHIAKRTDREYAVAVNSGTTALYAMLVANDITDGEVIVPSFTFPATANAVVAAGAEPVFADIERESLALDVASVEEKLTDETRAIMPIHFAGDISARINDLVAIAAEHGIPLFEDACHSLGADYNGDVAGSFGTAATFSFCFNKIITTGEGGMVVTDDESLAKRLRQFRSHGQTEDKEYVSYGHNFRMSSINAALGVAQAEKLDKIIARRHKMATYLNDRLTSVEGFKCPIFPKSRNRVYQLYNLRLDDPSEQRDLAEFLDGRGIPTRVTYNPVHLTTYYKQQWEYGRGDLPVTEELSRRILTLPFHLGLEEADLDRIASSVEAFFEEAP